MFNREMFTRDGVAPLGMQHVEDSASRPRGRAYCVVTKGRNKSVEDHGDPFADPPMELLKVDRLGLPSLAFSHHASVSSIDLSLVQLPLPPEVLSRRVSAQPDLPNEESPSSADRIVHIV